VTGNGNLISRPGTFDTRAGGPADGGAPLRDMYSPTDKNQDFNFFEGDKGRDEDD
jgi:hypothetical protein